ncbi:MAG: hypothetical protein LBL01_01935 [Bifidobacteriaceae bacterium]|jgi:hypothetical protein|nr:hypothetical protein [Bifidobacteriaceae bacterium]
MAKTVIRIGIEPETEQTLAWCGEIRRLGGEVPAATAAAVGKVEALLAARPRTVGAAAVEAAYQDGQFDQTERLAVEAASGKVRVAAWEAALRRAKEAVNSSLFNHLNGVIESFRPAAEAVLAELRWWADAGSPDPGQLLRDGHPKDAKRAACVRTHFEVLADMARVRDEISQERRGRPYPAWENPQAAVEGLEYYGRWSKQLHELGLEQAAELIRAGARPVWPTREQADAALEEGQAAYDARNEAAWEERERSRLPGGGTFAERASRR